LTAVVDLGVNSPQACQVLCSERRRRKQEGRSREKSLHGELPFGIQVTSQDEAVSEDSVD
jgi:hypothetical protein